jgi:hypothetical protein
MSFLSANDLNQANVCEKFTNFTPIIIDRKVVKVAGQIAQKIKINDYLSPNIQFKPNDKVRLNDNLEGSSFLINVPISQTKKSEIDDYNYLREDFDAVSKASTSNLGDISSLIDPNEDSYISNSNMHHSEPFGNGQINSQLSFQSV